MNSKYLSHGEAVLELEDVTLHLVGHVPGGTAKTVVEIRRTHGKTERVYQPTIKIQSHGGWHGVRTVLEVNRECHDVTGVDLDPLHQALADCLAKPVRRGNFIRYHTDRLRKLNRARGEHHDTLHRADG